MKKIEIKKEKFLQSLVFMFMGLDMLELNQRTLFLLEVIKNSPKGYAVINEIKPNIMKAMLMSSFAFDKNLQRLEYSGHIRKESGILYLSPKYLAILQCDGAILICEKGALNNLDTKE